MRGGRERFRRWAGGGILSGLSGLIPVVALAAPAPGPGPAGPDWSRLDPWQETMDAETLAGLLDRRLAPLVLWRDSIRMMDTGAAIATGEGEEPYWLRWPRPVGSGGAGPAGTATGEAPEAPWRLAGKRVALDPGHVGGAYGGAEGRRFRMEETDAWVQEGDLVLEVARRLAPRLEAAGAEVVWVRDRAEPVSGLAGGGGPFNVGAEIRARAARVAALRPDLVLALHINAAPWKDPARPALVAENHVHVIVFGNVLPGEWEDPAVRLETLVKALRGDWRREAELGAAVARQFLALTGLPATRYRGASALPVTADGAVWARNLGANRLFPCPVVYCEPFVANSVEGYAALQRALRRMEGRPAPGDEAWPDVLDLYGEAVLRGLSGEGGAGN